MAVRISKPASLLAAAMVLPTALISFQSQAEPLNLDYVQLSYTSHDYNALPDRLSGFELELSKTFGEGFFGFLEYFDVDDTILANEVSFSAYRVGAGYTESVNDSTDIVARLAYVKQELESTNVETDATGFAVSVGLNYNVTEALEVSADFRLENIADSDVVFTLGAEYNISDETSAVASFEAADDGDIIAIGARYSF